MNKEDDRKIVGKTDVGGRTGWTEGQNAKRRKVTMRENGS